MKAVSRASARASVPAMSDETPSVVVRSEGGIARVILVRPERRNAFDAQMVEELSAAFA